MVVCLFHLSNGCLATYYLDRGCSGPMVAMMYEGGDCTDQCEGTMRTEHTKGVPIPPSGGIVRSIYLRQCDEEVLGWILVANAMSTSR